MRTINDMILRIFAFVMVIGLGEGVQLKPSIQ